MEFLLTGMIIFSSHFSILYEYYVDYPTVWHGSYDVCMYVNMVLVLKIM